MTDPITQQQINQTAWAACDTFRGAVDAGQYKDYILVMGATKIRIAPPLSTCLPSLLLSLRT